MKIRIAFVNDIPKIIEVAAATWKQTYAPILSQEQIDFMYERMYTSEAILQQMQNGNTFLICSENEKILGFISYILREDNCICIPKIYVKPDTHGKGIGKLLLQEVEKIAQKNKLDFIELNVNRKNPAMYFYKKIGFELHEKVDIAIGKYWMNDYVLRKQISQYLPTRQAQ
ncbi:MAG TPA: GNAT family N-acetyltransferase [Chitinophagales bacterium]|nr:GNAT family N-acetyltransferase [Chitinophagales bacterium]HNF51923.1 GNAT family N-acetyltransferase [Chitinophagales bacterium]